MENFYKNPPTYDNVKKHLEKLKNKYTNLKIFSIGKSENNRDINALCIGSPTSAALMVGATHGLEWLTCLLLIKFCEDLLHAMEEDNAISEININKALKHRSLVIIPCLNPDGVEIALKGYKAEGIDIEFIKNILGDKNPKTHWQSNANGIDINHNFDAGWCLLREMEKENKINSPSYTRYGGTCPHSEEETAAIAAFCITYQPRTLYAFHSQGEEIFYNYGKNTPYRSKLMAQILSSSSGYKLQNAKGLASHGGLKDWFIEKFHRPGFTIEIGRGKNPLNIDKLDKIYSKIKEMLIIAALM